MAAQETKELEVLFKGSVGFGMAKAELEGLGFSEVQSRQFGNLVLCKVSVPADEVEGWKQRIEANPRVATVREAA